MSCFVPKVQSDSGVAEPGGRGVARPLPPFQSMADQLTLYINQGGRLCPPTTIPPIPQIFRLSSIPECHVAANNSKLVGGGVETWHESSKESKLSIFAIQVKSQNAYIQILLLGFNTWPQQETKCHLALVYTISQGQIRKVSAVCRVGLV